MPTPFKKFPFNFIKIITIQNKQKTKSNSKGKILDNRKNKNTHY